MFQPELRRALEKMGRSGFAKKILTSDLGLNDTSTLLLIDELAKSAEYLSRTATGALVVIERSTKLGEQIASGTIIDAVPSDQLFRNIFFKNSPLHDGAVIIRGNKIYAAGCFLPKPQNEESISKDLGTRHRAAVGISEISDAITIVVSEETGIISVVENGKIKRGFDRDKLSAFLEEKLSEKKTAKPERIQKEKPPKNNGNHKKGGRENA
jgi:diadenylate cyclase